MDDFHLSSLTESRNEYSMLLLSKLCPAIYQGFDSIFNDTISLCEENDEEDKYLMTFQNFLARVPKWNDDLVNKEVERIKEDTSCSYLEELLNCVYITQLKILTNVRTNQREQKISMDIASLHSFVHKVYTECARRLYKNAFLYELDVLPLQKQKNKREVENIINESIMHVIRSNMPIETILKSYLEENDEEVELEDEENVEPKQEAVQEEVKVVQQTPLVQQEQQTQTATTQQVQQPQQTQTVTLQQQQQPKKVESPKAVPSVNPSFAHPSLDLSSFLSSTPTNSPSSKKVGFIGDDIDIKDDVESVVNSSDSDSDVGDMSDMEGKLSISTANLGNDFKLDIETV